jgi:hypothetical protein
VVGIAHSQVRLFEEDPSYCTYGEAYEINCARFGREPDMPILHFKKRISGPDGHYLQDQDHSIRLAAFTEITERSVSENVFSQYIYKTLPTCNHLWAFKKYFCGQMALSGGKEERGEGSVHGWRVGGGGWGEQCGPWCMRMPYVLVRLRLLRRCCT